MESNPALTYPEDSLPPPSTPEPAEVGHDERKFNDKKRKKEEEKRRREQEVLEKAEVEERARREENAAREAKAQEYMQMTTRDQENLLASMSKDESTALKAVLHADRKYMAVQLEADGRKLSQASDEIKADPALVLAAIRLYFSLELQVDLIPLLS